VTGSSRPASRIVVLMGGPSAEREVSLSTGQGCAEALRSEGYDVVEVDAGPDLALRLADIMPDVVFNALHGRWGEDGCVQGCWNGCASPTPIPVCWPRRWPWTRQKHEGRVSRHGLPVADSVIAPAAEVEGAM
jgi:D-alanine-D-alanine ligase